MMIIFVFLTQNPNFEKKMYAQADEQSQLLYYVGVRIIQKKQGGGTTYGLKERFVKPINSIHLL